MRDSDSSVDCCDGTSAGFRSVLQHTSVHFGAGSAHANRSVENNGPAGSPYKNVAFLGRRKVFSLMLLSSSLCFCTVCVCVCV